MRLYALFWIDLAVSQIVALVLQTTKTLIDDPHDLSVLRIDMASCSFGYLSTFGTLGLDLLMLYSYHRLGTKLSQQATLIVTDELSSLMHENQQSQESQDR